MTSIQKRIATMTSENANQFRTTPRILVVDDVEANRAVVARRLEPMGFDVTCVESGERALQFVDKDRPDLVLLDYMMPKMNGIEVLKVLREEWKMTDLPVIMLTARAEADAVVTALDAGADDYISKPIDFDVLNARIVTQLGRSEASDRLRRSNATLDETSSIRTLAFEELKLEVEREMKLRQELERKLANTTSDRNGSGIPVAKIENARRIVSSVMLAAKSGRPINLAQLDVLDSLLAELAPTARKAGT